MLFIMLRGRNGFFNRPVLRRESFNWTRIRYSRLADLPMFTLNANGGADTLSSTDIRHKVWRIQGLISAFSITG